MIKPELQQRVEALAIEFMRIRGYDDRNKWPIEWDRNLPDSQFTFCLEDALTAVIFLYTNFEI